MRSGVPGRPLPAPRRRRRAGSIVAIGVLATVAGALAASSVMAAAGDLDPTFSRDGKVRTPVGGDNDLASGVAIDSQGRIVVAGSSQNGSTYQFGLVRYRPNGSLDTSFSGDGKVMTPFGTNADVGAVAIDSRDRIVLAGARNNSGNWDFAVARYRPNGALDTSFSGDGRTTTSFGTADDTAAAVAIDRQDRIVAGGNAGGDGGHFALARYRTNGSLDPSFSGDGQQRIRIREFSEIGGLAIDSEDRIVAAGSAYDGVQGDFAVVRYRPNGSLDPGFAEGGKALTPIGSADDRALGVAIDSQDRAVAVGQAQQGYRLSFALARYRADGSPDQGFSHDGKTITPVAPEYSAARGVAVDAQGRTVAAGEGSPSSGSYNDFALARYRPNGSLDPAFSGDGKKLTSFGPFGDTAAGVAIDAQGRIVAGGTASPSATERDFAVARYLG